MTRFSAAAGSHAATGASRVLLEEEPPTFVDGRFQYATDPAYLARYAARYVQAGAAPAGPEEGEEAVTGDLALDGQEDQQGEAEGLGRECLDLAAVDAHRRAAEGGDPDAQRRAWNGVRRVHDEVA